MNKKGAIDVLKTALAKLRYTRSKGYNNKTIDDISWIFGVVLRNVYGIEEESTKDELKKIILEREFDDYEILLKIVGTLDDIKYKVRNPSKKRVRNLISVIIKHFSNRIIILDYIGEIENIKDMSDYIISLRDQNYKKEDIKNILLQTSWPNRLVDAKLNEILGFK